MDVHRAVALAAVGDTSGAQRLVDTLQARVEVEVGVGVHPANEVVATLSAAFTAHAAGEWEHAIRLFETALADTVRIGGSRAQRDLVEFTLIAACLKARRADDARRIMTRRTDRKSTVNVAGFATRC